MIGIQRLLTEQMQTFRWSPSHCVITWHQYLTFHCHQVIHTALIVQEKTSGFPDILTNRAFVRLRNRKMRENPSSLLITFHHIIRSVCINVGKKSAAESRWTMLRIEMCRINLLCSPRSSLCFCISSTTRWRRNKRWFKILTKGIPSNRSNVSSFISSELLRDGKCLVA